MARALYGAQMGLTVSRARAPPSLAPRLIVQHRLVGVPFRAQARVPPIGHEQALTRRFFATGGSGRRPYRRKTASDSAPRPSANLKSTATTASELVEQICNELKPASAKHLRELAQALEGIKPLAGPRSVTVWFDGGARPNPGKGGCGAVVKDRASGEQVYAASVFLGDGVTNNEAEYQGAIEGVIAAFAMGAKEIELIGDSKLVSSQIAGKMQASNPRMALLREVAQLCLSSIPTRTIRHVLRAENADADALASQAIIKAMTQRDFARDDAAKGLLVPRIKTLYDFHGVNPEHILGMEDHYAASTLNTRACSVKVAELTFAGDDRTERASRGWSGAILRTGTGRKLVEVFRCAVPLGETADVTADEAAYLALLEGVLVASLYEKVGSLVLRTDSKRLQGQLLGLPDARTEQKAHLAAVRSLLSEFDDVQVKLVTPKTSEDMVRSWAMEVTTALRQSSE